MQLALQDHASPAGDTPPDRHHEHPPDQDPYSTADSPTPSTPCRAVPHVRHTPRVQWLAPVGVGTSLVGVFITIIGLYQGFTEIRAENERLLGPIVNLIITGVRWPAAQWEKFRDRKNVTVHDVSGAAHGRGPNETVNVERPPLDSDPAKAVQELDRFTRTTWDQLKRLQHNFDAQAQSQERRAEMVQVQLRNLIHARADQERVRAVRGIRIELLGLLLIGVGTAMQGWATFL